MLTLLYVIPSKLVPESHKDWEMSNVKADSLIHYLLNKNLLKG